MAVVGVVASAGTSVSFSVASLRGSRSSAVAPVVGDGCRWASAGSRRGRSASCAVHRPGRIRRRLRMAVAAQRCPACRAVRPATTRSPSLARWEPGAAAGGCAAVAAPVAVLTRVADGILRREAGWSAASAGVRVASSGCGWCPRRTGSPAARWRPRTHAGAAAPPRLPGWVGSCGARGGTGAPAPTEGCRPLRRGRARRGACARRAARISPRPMLFLDPLHPARRPPAVVAEHLHDRRHQEHPDDGGVQQQGDEQAEGQVLHHHQVGERERARDHGQHQRRTGDEPSGGGGTDADGLGGRHPAFAGLHHAGHQEHLVVGGQTPDHRDDQADHRRHQRLRRVVQQPGAVPVDEHPRQDAHRRTQRERAHQRRLDRQHQRSERQEHQDRRVVITRITISGSLSNRLWILSCASAGVPPTET